MKILIAGANGQLAREFQRTLTARGVHFLAPDEHSLDITDAAVVRSALEGYRPDIVINGAAYNLVDKAETDTERVFAVNALGPAYLAEACVRQDIPLVHYSSDYVFDGAKEGFYGEDDRTNPINCYGASKREGEQRVMASGCRFLLFRTSWVFGHGSQNFLHKLLQWSQQQAVLRVVTDQVSIPTFTEDIVRYTLLALDEGLQGLYHLTNSGYATRYEVARYFLEQSGKNTILLPVTGEFFPTPAKRPYFTAMANERLTDALKKEIPHWKDAIDRFIASTP
jgi:dTDP-4-dehydrorhamnose reductase